MSKKNSIIAILHFIILVSLPLFVSGADNLIVNGSFEDDTGFVLAPWIANAGVMKDSVPPAGGGSWCAKISGGDVVAAISQEITAQLDSGQIVQLSCYAKADTFTQVSFSFVVNGITTLQQQKGPFDWKKIDFPDTISFPSNEDLSFSVLISVMATQWGKSGISSIDLVELKKMENVEITTHKTTLLKPITLHSNSSRSLTTITFPYFYTSFSLGLFDASGRCVEQYSNLSGDSFFWSTETMTPGLYFVKVFAGDVKYTAKVLYVK